MGTTSSNTKVTKYTGVQIQTSALGVPITLFWGQQRVSNNLIWKNNFQRVKQKSSGGKGGGKGGSTYDYYAAMVMALCEGPAEFVSIWSSSDETTLSSEGVSYMSGTGSQTPPSWIQSSYPSEALSYPYTAYVWGSKVSLGTSDTMPSYAFELLRIPSGFDTTGSPDVNMADVIPDFLTNTQYRVGNLTSTDIDSTTLATYKDYITANGLFLSPILTDTTKATDILDRWAALTNTWIFWAGTSIMFVPLGDSTVTGNGVTYTPDLTPAYNLTLDDILADDPPIKITRKDPSDCNNRTRIQIKQRSNEYNSYVCEYLDQTLFDQFGLVESGSTQGDEVCVAEIGQKIAELVGKRAAYIRKTYSFSTSFRFTRLLPGSIVTIPDPDYSGSAIGVRITDVECDEDGKMTFTAEEFPGCIGTANASSWQGTSNTSVSHFVDPGDCNTPCIWEPNTAYTGGTAEILYAASGGEYWGGCYVYISFDQSTWSQIGEIAAPAKQGLLTAALADATGLDTIHTLAIDLAESQTTIDTATEDDADNYRTLAVITPQPSSDVLSNSGEALSYGSVSATGTYSSDLTYLHRGIYGSSHAAHAVGAQFTQIDTTGTAGTLGTYALPAKYIGTTVYLKFCAYNIFGNMAQSTDDVTTYSYIPTGAGYGSSSGGSPATPTGLSTTAGANSLVISWASNASTDNVTAYTLYAAEGSGKSFSDATQIYSGLSTTYTYSSLDTNTTYTLFLTATNAAGTSSAESASATTSSTSGYDPLGSAAAAQTTATNLAHALTFLNR